jgi:hypothetical protein
MTARRYCVTVRGSLSPRFAEAFEGVRFRSDNGLTVLEGERADQAQLYGLLERGQDLGLDVVRVEEVAD